MIFEWSMPSVRIFASMSVSRTSGATVIGAQTIIGPGAAPRPPWAGAWGAAAGGCAGVCGAAATAATTPRADNDTNILRSMNTPQENNAAESYMTDARWQYPPELMNALAGMGLAPTAHTPPGLVRDQLNDLYRFELRRTRDQLLAGVLAKPAYLDRVIALRKYYWPLSLPLPA